jgi:hypothetical protein
MVEYVILDVGIKLCNLSMVLIYGPTNLYVCLCTKFVAG